MSYFNNIADPITGKQVWVSEFHDLRASPLVRLAGTSFVGSTKDTNFWTDSDTGTGSTTQGAGIITLATGATANSTAQYQSVRMARWVPGAENTFRTILKVADTGTANNTRNWGAFSATDGFYFQLTGTTLNIVSLSGSTPTAVAQASWNVNTAFTLDTSYHIYEIKYTYADIHFYIDGILHHTLKPTTTFFAQTLNLPITLQNNNSGGSTANVSMMLGVAFVTRTGQLTTETQYNRITGANTAVVLKYGAGRLIRVFINGSGTSATLYDNTTNSGTVIANLSLPSGVCNSIEFGCPFSNGLTVHTVGAGVDITAIYE